MNEKKKFNIIDVIIILSILLVIGTSVYRAISIKKSDNSIELKPVVYTLDIVGLDSIYMNALNKGDELYLSEKAIREYGLTTR